MSLHQFQRCVTRTLITTGMSACPERVFPSRLLLRSEFRSSRLRSGSDALPRLLATESAVLERRNLTASHSCSRLRNPFKITARWTPNVIQSAAYLHRILLRQPGSVRVDIAYGDVCAMADPGVKAQPLSLDEGQVESGTASKEPIRSTAYHAKYFAYELTKRCASDSMEKLAASLANAQVDLNPHQVEAALFAFRSPLSKGAILADEVGLGKTIEAGILLSQKWAERKRKILIIVPASLRNQWHQELSEKFFLPSAILEA